MQHPAEIFVSAGSLVLSLVAVEALLSVDNVLAIVAIARALPHEEQARARGWGMALGVVFRILALLLAATLVNIPAVRYVGAGYLVYLAVAHFLLPDNKLEAQRGAHHFRKVVLSIAVADIAFSLDNVVAAVGLSRDIPVVIAGVVIGIGTMYFASHWVAKLVHRYPRLADVAFLVVGFIGLTMLGEELLGWGMGSLAKLLVIIGLVGITVAYEEGRRR